MNTSDRVLQYLQTYDLKQDGRNKWRCNSPLRPGSDSQGFSLTIDGPENGAYYDHVTKDKGSLYELAKALGIPIPAAPHIESTKRQYTGIHDYAKAHGVTEHVLEAWKWRETDYRGRRALEFPTRTGNRWRFLDGGKPHYVSEQGYIRCWYGLSEQVLSFLEHEKLLVICNGEISTIAAQVHSLCAIAVTSGEKEIPSNLLSELKGKTTHIEGLKVLVAMDCDSAGVKAATIVLEQLKLAGFDARAVDLQLGLGGDLADFCMLYGKDVKARLLQLPDIKPNTTSTERNFAFYTLDQVLSLPPVTWLVRGVLPAVGLSMVYGPSGVGKSFYALSVAYDLAFEHSVIYVAAEGETGMGIRTRALIQHNQGKRPSKLTYVLGAVDLFDDEELVVFKSLSAQYKPSLIVVDTLAMCTGVADENSARDMKTIVDGCKRMAKELQCAVLLVHHTNKQGREPRGSGSLFNACDTVIRLTRADDVLVVESQKTKDLKSFSPLYLKEVTVELGKDEDGELVSSLVLLPAEKVIETDELTDMQRLLLETLSVDPAMSVRDLANVAEVSNPATIARALGKLEKLGFISPYNNGQRLLTDDGKKALTVTGVTPVTSVTSHQAYPPEHKTSETHVTPVTPVTPVTLEGKNAQSVTSADVDNHVTNPQSQHKPPETHVTPVTPPLKGFEPPPPTNNPYLYE